MKIYKLGHPDVSTYLGLRREARKIEHIITEHPQDTLSIILQQELLATTPQAIDLARDVYKEKT